MKLNLDELSECTFQTSETTYNNTNNTSTPTYSVVSTVMQQTNYVLPPIYCVGIDSVNNAKVKMCFSQPIIAIVGYKDALYSMENKDLGIVTMSKDYDECLQDFKNEVLFILKEYSEENDNNLTIDAQELKSRILQYLKK